MKFRGSLICVLSFSLLFGACLLLYQRLPSQTVEPKEIIWEISDTIDTQVIGGQDCLAILARSDTEYSVHLVDLAGRALKTVSLGPDWFPALTAGASASKPLFCIVAKKDDGFQPLVADMREGKLIQPVLEMENAVPRVEALAPHMPALCPCGGNMLIHGSDTESGQIFWKSWVVDSLSGDTIREVAIRPKGRVSFVNYVWDDDCTLTWLNRETGLIINEKKGVLSEVCRDLIVSLPDDMSISLSPDASAIAVYNPRTLGDLHISFYDTVDGEKKESQLAIGKEESIKGVYWSPDSSKVCVGLVESGKVFTSGLYVIREDGKIGRIDLPGWQFFGFYGSITWLYDSRHIACALVCDDKERTAVALFDVNEWLDRQ